MIRQYFSLKKLGLPLILAGLLLLLLAGPALSATVELLNDGFENTSAPFDKWDGNGATNWSISSNISHSGNRSARGNHGANKLASDDLDTSDAVSIEVSFWFRKTDLTADNFKLYYCYGADICNPIADLDLLGPDDTWLPYTETITDPQYFTSTFYVLLVGPPPPSERVYVDDVLITKETGELQTLMVSKTGTGSGTVTSNPAGIDCGSDCSEAYAYNTMVTLSAAAATGSTFTGWSGSGCSGTGDCVVTMDAAKSVYAEFTLNTYTLSVSKGGNGSGTVTSVPTGIDCGSDCSQAYGYNTEVTLSAVVAAGSTFSGWSGACTGTGSCMITMDAARSVTAEFTLDEYTLIVNVVGNGTVAKDPNQATYHYGNVVGLNATAGAGWAFAGWSGDLTGTDNPDSLTMDGDKTVTATFTEVTHYINLPIIFVNSH